MIQHVYERVLKAMSVSFAAVATDDERIFAAVRAFGGRAVMTSPRRRSGTDRIAEAVDSMGLADDDIVVRASHRAGTVTIVVECPVTAPRDIVWDVLTDYDGMARFISNVEQSVVRLRFEFADGEIYSIAF